MDDGQVSARPSAHRFQATLTSCSIPKIWKAQARGCTANYGSREDLVSLHDHSEYYEMLRLSTS